MKRQPTPAAIDLDAALAGVAAMNVEQLRDLWRQKCGQEPPAAFSKDLIDRALAYWLQEEAFVLIRAFANSSAPAKRAC
jgi:hypothetical protein